MGHLGIQKWPQMSQKTHLGKYVGNPLGPFLHHFWTILMHFRPCLIPPKAKFTREMGHLGVKKWPKMGQKWHFSKSMGNPLGPFWDPFGTILRHFWPCLSPPTAKFTMEMGPKMAQNGSKMICHAMLALQPKGTDLGYHLPSMGWRCKHKVER